MKKYTLRALSGFLVALMLLPLWLVPVSADGEAPAIDTLIEAVRLTTNEKGEARLCSPLGIRFVTSFSLSAYETLKNDARVESVRQGTLIAPMDTVLEAGAFTKEALGERSYLDVAATDEAWYSVDQRNDTACFAGSVWEIRAEHINTTFAGVGYLEVTLKDGEVLTVYGATDPDRIPSVTLAIASVIGLRRNDLNDAQIYALTQLKNKFDGDDEMLYRQDFKNLNVLAIGDSLFSGAFDTVGDKVWVNLLGKTYSWNLTNLGVGGATLTYDPDRTASNKSMYGMLMNDPDYSYGSPSYYSAGTPSQNADEVDLILLEGGSNDYGSSVQAPLGAIADRTPDTFLGAWYLMVDELLSRYSNATIVLLTAWENVNQNREDGALAIDYTSSVKKVYTTYYKNNPRVRFINAGDPDVSGVNMASASFRRSYGKSSSDSNHLNATGMKLMKEAMLPLLWEIMVP